ncbi:hypothetical protein [Ferruginibacter albus]|uniref:hypothetical protein n=1 Tax=Ferruginibacter albus TaxID=2875540 RepID=UPI001CC66662|nr:hypothetical protein [Ferruginibacter albus]UAY53634.1 hypothetical protein K9M53_08190 [Ferruginibacter albus]
MENSCRQHPTIKPIMKRAFINFIILPLLSTNESVSKMDFNFYAVDRSFIITNKNLTIFNNLAGRQTILWSNVATIK